MNKIQVIKKFTLTGHKDCIYTLAGYRDKTKFFSGAGDGLIVLWDLNMPENGKLIAKVNASVYAIHYNPLNDILVIGQNYEGIHLIEATTKKHIGSLKLTSSAIFDIKLFNNKILVGTGDGELIVINQEKLLIEQRIKFSDKSLRTIEIDEAHNLIVTGFSDDVIRIIEMDNFLVINELRSHKNSIFTLCISPDKKYMLSAGRDAQLKIWDIINGYELKESIVAHMYTINHVVFSHDKRYFATCSMDKSIKVWDAEKFILLKVIDKARHAGHGTSVNKLYWADYNNYLISCSDDRSISVWDIFAGKETS